MEQNGVRNFRYISSVNIRVAHQVRGCADAVMPYLTSQGNVYSTLIIAPPGCGKTTLLRDMIRQIANGCDHLKGKTVGVVDERSELGGCYLGIRSPGCMPESRWYADADPEYGTRGDRGG